VVRVGGEAKWRYGGHREMLEAVMALWGLRPWWIWRACCAAAAAGTGQVPCRSLGCDGRIDDLWRLAFRRGGDTACPPWMDCRSTTFNLQSKHSIGTQTLRDITLVSRAKGKWRVGIKRDSKWWLTS